MGIAFGSRLFSSAFELQGLGPELSDVRESLSSILKYLLAPGMSEQAMASISEFLENIREYDMPVTSPTRRLVIALERVSFNRLRVSLFSRHVACLKNYGFSDFLELDFSSDEFNCTLEVFKHVLVNRRAVFVFQ